MKKYIVLAAAISLACTQAFAQLSDRVNNPSTFKIGTRPVQGNMGITIGTSYVDLKKIFDKTQDYTTMPIVSFKYYQADDLVITIGIKSTKSKRVSYGEADSLLNDLRMKKNDMRDIENKFMIVPGIEKHFLSSNIFDVYCGARIPLGYVKDVNENNIEFYNGNFSYSTDKRLSYMYGVDAFVGLQFFVADLPLALGLEVGYSGCGFLSNKTRHDREFNYEGVSGQQTFYSTAGDDFNYTKLKAKTYDSETDVRISLNYFFKK